jgi:diphthamide synthase (EF-2-diphthine--ammonia ligase)
MLLVGGFPWAYTPLLFGCGRRKRGGEYRVRLLQGTGIEPLFPIWTTAEDTPTLARTMLAAGLGAVLTCVDPKQLSERFVGRRYDEALLAELPAGVDPCGERGEFHTFCDRSPVFSTEIPVSPGEIVDREGFWFCDLCRSPGAVSPLGHPTPRMYL